MLIECTIFTLVYRWTSDQLLAFKTLYTEGYSVPDIAHQYGVHPETIQLQLKKLGVRMRKAGVQTARHAAKVRGPNHGGWKGGREKHSSGYIFLYDRSHPRANASGGFCTEHRYIMEQHLLATNPTHEALVNGQLSREWHVHHKNHIKDDNRLENLELMKASEHAAYHAPENHKRRWHPD